MKLLPLNKLGARETNGIVEFGLFLPWVSAKDGNRLRVKVIHEQDQFLQDMQPSEFELTRSCYVRTDDRRVRHRYRWDN